MNLPAGAEDLRKRRDPSKPGYLLLEDSTRFDGVSCGADGEVVGEVVFTTAMSGYQESFSDPSFAGQLIAFTYPHIGNYGTAPGAMESPRPWARGAIMRAARNLPARAEQAGWCDWLRMHDIPALSEVDTRALVRHIRSAGAMRGGIFSGATSERKARELIGAEPTMIGRNLAAEVCVRAPLALADEGALDAYLLHGGADGQGACASGAGRAALAEGAVGAGASGRGGGQGPLIAVLDTGVKSSILRALLARGARLILYPYSTPAEEILASGAQALLLANGPGDPGAVAEAIERIRALIGRMPLYGICLGHQLLCRAIGLETFKLPFGHRGANHPVKDLRSGRIAITSQNHGFAVRSGEHGERLEGDRPLSFATEFGGARLTHVNLYDRTVEGVELLDVPAAAVQYHPEAGPGPHDSLYIFAEILALAEGAGRS
jgi:carbamoyl-phosphate synthase small subunit